MQNIRTLTFVAKAKRGEKYTPLRRGQVLARIVMELDEDNFLAWADAEWGQEEWDARHEDKEIFKVWKDWIKSLEISVRDDIFQGDAFVVLESDFTEEIEEEQDGQNFTVDVEEQTT